MFNSIKKIIFINLSILTLGIFSSLYAATADISASSLNVTEGTAVSINVSINAATWNVHVSGNVSDSIVGYDENAVNKATSKSYTLDTSVAGTYTVSISGDVTDADGTNSSVANSVTVVVNKKEVPPVEEPTTPTETPETNNNNTNNSSDTNINTNINTNTTTTPAKSSNANLKNLVIDQEGLSPMFSSSITNYSLTVPSNVTSLKITPTMEQAGAKYWVTGDENLQMGTNKVTVTVTAPDGTKKTYTINVDRVEDTNKADAALKSLIIDGVELSPEFTPETLDYDLGSFDYSVKKLTILAFANSENAKVEIQGNENFKVGENIIKVVVTAEDHTTTKEYTLKFNRDEEVIVEEIKEENPYQYVYEEPTMWENIVNNAKENKLLLIVLLVAIIELIQIILLYRKNKLNQENNFSANYDIKLDEIEQVKALEVSKRRRKSNAEEELLEQADKVQENIENNTIQEEIVENEDKIEEQELESSEEEQILNLDNLDELKDETKEEVSIDEKITQGEETIEPNESQEEKKPEIDFESLVKETLEKYEEEDKKEVTTNIKLDLEAIENNSNNKRKK